MFSKAVLQIAAYYFVAVLLSHNLSDAGYDPSHPCRKEVTEPNLGHCNNYFGSYYWHPESLTCKKFLYEGCGHFKHFKTKKECEDECKIVKA